MRVGFGQDIYGTAKVMVFATARPNGQGGLGHPNVFLDRMQSRHCAWGIRIEGDQAVADDAAKFVIGIM